MNFYRAFALIFFVLIIFSPNATASNSVVVDFVDTNTGERPENINLEIISENGESWNVTTFPKELYLEPGNYSVIGTVNIFGKTIILDSLSLQKIELQTFEVGSGRDNYTITNNDYSNYGLTVVGEYKFVNNTEFYTTFVTLKVGPIQYIVYGIYAAIGITTLGLMKGLLNGLKKIENKAKKRRKKMEEREFELEPEFEYDPKLIDLNYEIITQDSANEIIDIDSSVKVSEAYKIMKMEDVLTYDIRIKDFDGNFRIISNSNYNSVLKKVNATNKIKSIAELGEIEEKFGWFKFLIKFILLILILLFGLSGVFDLGFGINDLLKEIEGLL